MSEVRKVIRFLLNDRPIELADLSATHTLLDFLRLNKMLRGTKEGCAEGDCGACTVLVGRLGPGGLTYEAVNACIRFVGSLDACHVVTIEHLRGADGGLHPVQQAMVDLHGSQCGFCTPGFVMSLYGLWMRQPDPSIDEVEQALQGNLCRCTGYAPIVRAGLSAAKYWTPAQDPLVEERETVQARLCALMDGRRVEICSGDERFIVPSSVDDLAQVFEAEPDARLVAGATDIGLWVTKFMRDISPLVFIGAVEGLLHVDEGAHAVTIGAGATYSQTMGLVARKFPQMNELWRRLGGTQVRNMGTIGGNIANGSPIGDTPPALIALGASITLRLGKVSRVVALEDFFIAYGKQDRATGEFLESISIPYLPADTHFAAYKISKRLEEDISALSGAFNVSIANGVVESVRIAFGGMAATPKRARAVEALLLGQVWDEATVTRAIAGFLEDFQPISDVRASAAYRELTAQNLLWRFYFETIGEPVRLARGAA